MTDPTGKAWFSWMQKWDARKPTAIKHGSLEHREWLAYFRSNGWTPAALRLLQPGRSATMPCQLPQQLPRGFPYV